MLPRDPEASDQEVLEALAAYAAARERDVIDRALEAARERLRMDAAYLSTITPDIQRVDRVAGDSSAMGFAAGTTLPLPETYCNQMLAGTLPNLVPDTSAEPGIAGLQVTTRVGAYVGVPIRLADGRLHGTLCAASAEPRPQFGREELRFMEVLAGILAGEIDRAEGSRAEAADRLLRRPAAGPDPD
jgi:GAF domain-containing protein